MATLAELRKKPEASLTPDEKIQLFGDPGPPLKVLYARRTVNGQEAIVCRTFPGDMKTGPEWVDSPAKLGAPESAPAAIVDGIDVRETVVAFVPAQQVEARSKAKAA